MTTLSKDEQSFREEMRELVTRVIDPAKIDAEDDVTEATFEALHPLLMLTTPKAYGGAGKSELQMCLAVEQLGARCPALVPYLEVGQLFAKAIEIGGTEDQKKRHLRRLAAGDLGAYALTDITPGSDPVNMATEARKQGDAYVVNGGKRHITYFKRANMMVLFVRMTGATGSRSLSALFFDAPFDGIAIQRRSEWTGLRGHNAWDLKIENARTNEIIGEEGGGLHIALEVLNHTRISLACGHVGLAQTALDVAVEFAKDRVVGGRALWKQQAIGFPLVELQAKIDAARLLAYQAARRVDDGHASRGATAMAKMLAADVLIESVTVSSRVLGGYGGHLDYPAERHLRDAFSWVAAQGTNEIQKLTAARELFA
jgi:alkylation response protein AidB-like acyl-CoA dehydrogenase